MAAPDDEPRLVHLDAQRLRVPREFDGVRLGMTLSEVRAITGASLKRLRYRHAAGIAVFEPPPGPSKKTRTPLSMRALQRQVARGPKIVHASERPTTDRGASYNGPPRPRPTRTRPCIRCRRPFESEGAHNRMCAECRAYASGVSGMDPFA